jgi:predicted DNA-binding transcriptional regulator AlpA
MPIEVVSQGKPVPAIQNVIPSELINFDVLPDSAHVPIDTVCGLYSCSIATVWRRVRSGQIIPPIRFGSRTTRWNVGGLRRALSKENTVGVQA